MSGQRLENFSPRIKEAIQELKDIQHARKYRRAVRRELGHGSAIWKDAEGITTGENRGMIFLENRENSELFIGAAQIPCNKITDWSYIDKVATFNLKDFPPAARVIVTVDSDEHIQNLVAHVQLAPVPRPLTFQNDGNITSSPSESGDSAESRDSARGRTTGWVANSFESDDSFPP